jgi:ATP-binding cassette subfamily C protein CydC
MSSLWFLIRLMLRTHRAALLRSGLLALLVLVMGAALLGLSGWFITTAALAGLAGSGAVFDVFRPSAGVRLLALGRGIARYGDRLLSHDVTFKALESLRMQVLRGLLAAEWPRLIRLRGAEVLNRLSADIDVLDGLVLRLVLPVAALLLVQLLAAGALLLLVGEAVALAVLAGMLGGSVLVLGGMAARTMPPARQEQAAAQRFRVRLLDLLLARSDLAVYGRLEAHLALVQAAERRRRSARRRLDRLDRTAGALLSLAALGAMTAALGLGLRLAQAGELAPELAALGFFAALGLQEGMHPLRRALADLGRMGDAARRVRRGLPQAENPAAFAAGRPDPAGQQDGEGGVLVVTDLHLLHGRSKRPIAPPVSFRLNPGETLVVTGASGAGKSTLLLTLAGLLPSESGSILLNGRLLEAGQAGAVLGLVPQRAGLMAGSIAEALRLGSPDAADEELWQVLDAVALTDVIRRKGGLTARLGARGAGLSGGEARRLVLARALLRHPCLLLLDEPTEGLDRQTAEAVLAGIRRFLPRAAIVMASHRVVEQAVADRILAL